jgi:hypothetical protein
VVAGGVVVVVVLGVVVVVGGGGLVVVVVEGEFRVVAVVGVTVGVVMGREVVVVVVGSTVVGPSADGAVGGGVAAAALVGVLAVESNRPAKSEFTDVAPGFGTVAVVAFFAVRGAPAVVGVVVAEAVLGPKAFDVESAVGPRSGDTVSFCRNAT